LKVLAKLGLAAAAVGLIGIIAGEALAPVTVAQGQTAAANVRRPVLGPACPNQITQSFPTTGPAETTWIICWREVRGNDSKNDPNGLVIGPVFFQKSPSAPSISVISDMRMSEIFVPYHPGHPRIYDLSAFNFKLTTLGATDCPASVGGTLLSSRVCKEVRDRGLMWKDFGGARRGQEIVLWGSIDAGNYRYIQEYTFRDDGVIMGRLGATGQNLPGAELVTHAHDAVWRIDMDLGGGVNTASRARHLEDPNDPSGQATDSTTLLTVAQSFNWNERYHDVMVIANPALTNAEGDVSTYHLMPLVTGGGVAQHRELFTRAEFWVTRFDSDQFAARRLPNYVEGSPSIAGEDIVVWIKGTLHHMPRSEDGVYNGGGQWIGTAHVMWTGFMLMPHDLFDCSPFYQPCPP
jgi:Cu2+-containing amine oxidase